MFAICLALLFPGTAPGFPPVLRTAHDVRALPLSEAKAGRFVSLRGTVTYAPRAHGHFYLQDDSGGVRVEWRMRNVKLNPGDTVELVGLTTAGAFVPEVRAGIVQVMPGTRDRLPKAQRFNLTTDEAYFLDAEWVTADVVVQGAWQPEENWLKLDLARGRGSVVACVPCGMPFDKKRASDLRGATVRVRGVWKRGTGGSDPSHLLVSDFDELVVIERPQERGSVPLVTARALDQPRSDPLAARRPVRVEGTITLNQAGKHFFVLDPTGVVQLRLRESVDLRPGQRVIAYGFPRAAGTTQPPLLENTTILAPDPVAPIDGLPLPAALPGATLAAAAAGKLEGRVARFTGKVLATGRQGDWATLTVLADPLTFSVVMVDPVAPVEVGSTVEVVGVVSRQQFDKFPRHTFALVARADGLKVIEGPPRAPEPAVLPPAPWWTGRRVAYLTAGFVGLFLLGGATVTALRVQVRRAKALEQKRSEEKRQLEGQLDRSGRLEAVGRVAGGVAHDFNNILTVINGCAQMLDEAAADDPERATTLANIRRAGRLAVVLSRMLLAFSRHRRGTPHPLDLNALIADAEPILARLLGNHTVLCFAPDPALPLALADTGLLLQILINLTVNASEAMPTGGTFTVATSVPEPGWVRLTATDTGAGMSAEVQARAFDRGFTTKPDGTGTGLATVYDAVRELGGRVRFDSVLGRGTAFEVDLPAAPRAGASADGPITVVIPSSPGNGPATSPTGARAVALLVEDDDGVRDYVRYVLESAGLTAVAVADPMAALRALDEPAAHFDLLMTDLELPGLDGRELAARVRAKFPNIRVLFMSGHPTDDLFPARGGDVHFLHKPFTPGELTEQLTQLLSQPSA